MIAHASASREHSARTSAASRALADHGSRLHIRHRHTSHARHIKSTQSNGGHSTAHVCNGATIRAARPVTRSHARPLPHCRNMPHAMQVSTIGAEQACRRCNERWSEETTKLEVAVRTSGRARPWRAGLVYGLVSIGGERWRYVQVARYLQGRAPRMCTPLVVSESSRELEHAELETKLVENTERMRRSSRRSHDLRGKGARMIAVSDQMQRHAA